MSDECNYVLTEKRGRFRERCTVHTDQVGPWFSHVRPDWTCPRGDET